MKRKRRTQKHQVIYLMIFLSATAVAQTPITWSDSNGPDYSTHASQVGLTLKAGSGPSSNRLDIFYIPAYIEGRGATPVTNMEDFDKDAAYRVQAGADMQQGIPVKDWNASGEVLVTPKPMANFLFQRYMPLTKVWELDSIRVDWPVYDRATQRRLFDVARANAGVVWGMGDFLKGYPGAGASGRWANSKVTGTPYIDYSEQSAGSIWAWTHEGTHAHHRLGHAGNNRTLDYADIDGEGVGLVRNATFEPTGSLFGAWHGYKGKHWEISPEDYPGAPGISATKMFDKDVYEGYIDVNIDNANYTENRADSIIFDYYKAVNPIDSHTNNDTPLTDPAIIEVNVASTDLITLRWYINGTEAVDQRGVQKLEIAGLNLASGQYHITAEAYDSAIDYAFTGDNDRDLIRHNFEYMMEKVGWVVNVSSNGSNAYKENATLQLQGDGAIGSGSFNTGTAGKIAVFPWNSQLATLSAGSLSMNGLRMEGDYLISGGEFNMLTGEIHTLPNSNSRINSNITFGKGIVKTGFGELALGGDNTLGSAQIEVKQGTLSATSANAFGDEPTLMIRRGAEVKLNAGVVLGNTTMEGYSALWCNAGTERASVKNLSLLRMGDENIGSQLHGYFKLGSGTFAFEGTTTLTNTVMLLTGANPSKVFNLSNEDDLNAWRVHWMTDMGRGATYELNDVTGRGSIVCKHGGDVRILGNVTLQGDHSDINDYNGLMGLMSIIYETHLTVEPSGQLNIDVIDLGPFSTFEYNAQTPLSATFMQAHQERPDRNYIWSFPGFYGRLSGTGDIGTLVSLRMNATVAPGASGEVGRQNYLAGMFVDNLAKYEWQLGDTAAGVDADGIPIGWDCIKVTGELDLNGIVKPWTYKGKEQNEPADEVVLMTVKVSDLNRSFPVMNFDTTRSQSFLIIEADTITGYADSKFEVEVDPSSTLGTIGGTWSVSNSGNKIFLNYRPGDGGGNNPPVWDSTTIVSDDIESGQVYSGSLAGNASDSDGQPLFFSKVSGPAWLIVGSEGELSGSPTKFDIGLNTWVVSVSDGIGAPVLVNVEITVLPYTNIFLTDGGSLHDAANWSKGVLPSADLPGLVGLDSTIDSVLTDFDLVFNKGTVTRNTNTVYQWLGDTDVVVDGGNVNFTASSASGDSHRVLRLKNTSSLVMKNGTLTLWSDRTFEIFDQGTILVLGGVINAGGIGDQDGSAQGAGLTFGLGNGQVNFKINKGINFTNGAYINYLNGSTGQLSVAGADRAYYNSLWDSGILRVNGANNGSFASLFKVDGETLTLSRDIETFEDVDNDALLDSWEVQHHGSTEVVSAESDVDGDGATAFYEMVFGGDPNVNDSNKPAVQVLFVDDADTTALEFRYRRPKNYYVLNVTYTLQESSDLIGTNWKPLPSLPAPVIVDDVENVNNEWVVYTIPLPGVGNSPKFYRCKVTPNGQ